MDGGDFSFAAEESLRAQGMESYLNDLKHRLKERCLQHDGIIKNSVNMINEIRHVASSHFPTETPKKNAKANKIQELIHKFEATSVKESAEAKSLLSLKNQLEAEDILKSFERLNESRLLDESLNLFLRAKEAFDDIESFLNNMGHTDNSNQLKYKRATSNTKFEDSMDISDDEVDGLKEPPPSRYASCCSMLSIDQYHSTQDFTSFEDCDSNTSEGSGYEAYGNENGYERLA